MRFLTAGESHGPELLAIIEGLPAGLPLSEEDINPWLEKRQKGYGRGRRMVIERDRVEFRAGVRGGRTTGAPVALAIKNADFKKSIEAMQAYRSDQYLWWQVAEYTYDSFMIRSRTRG